MGAKIIRFLFITAVIFIALSGLFNLLINNGLDVSVPGTVPYVLATIVLVFSIVSVVLLILAIMALGIIWLIRKIFRVESKKEPISVIQKTTVVKGNATVVYGSVQTTRNVITGNNSSIQNNSTLTSNQPLNDPKLIVMYEQLLSEVLALKSKIEQVDFDVLNALASKLKVEGSKAEPTRSVFDVTLKGLKDATVALGEIAVPVLKIVSAILAATAT